MDNYKNAIFDTSKKNLGPVHLLPKMDKWDYLRSPIIDFFFVSCFDIGEVPGSPETWNLNWLYFLPFIFTFEQCVKLVISQAKLKSLQFELKPNLAQIKSIPNIYLIEVILFVYQWFTLCFEPKSKRNLS